VAVQQWEIRLTTNEVFRLSVEDERDLTQEHFELEADFEVPRWKFWRRRPSPYWRISNQLTIHKDVILAVVLKKPRAPRPKIGFCHHE
jgi:hypothetical protein